MDVSVHLMVNKTKIVEMKLKWRNNTKCCFHL